MKGFVISGFSDEISPDPEIQFETLKRLGIGYTEIRGVSGKSITSYEPEEVYEIKKIMDRYGIGVSAIGSPIGKIGIKDDFEKHMELLERTLDIADILKTGFVRVFSFYVGNEPSLHRDEVLEKMEKMTAAAEKRGILLCHENEKNIYGDTPERCLDISDSIGKDRIGLIFDPANYVQCGMETYPATFEQLKDRITYMHIKDAVKDTGEVVPAGSGDAFVKEILCELKSGGFNGFLSLEPHLKHFKGFEKLELNPDGRKSEGNGEQLFELAYSALMDIIQSI